MLFLRIEDRGLNIGLTRLPRRHRMRLTCGDTVAEPSAAIEAEWRLTNLYSQGKTLGREQCTWWD